MAEAMLNQEYEDPSVNQGHTNICRLGRIGSLNVVISYLPEPPGTADAAHIAQNMTTSFRGIKVILMTGFCAGDPSAGIRLGDLVINPVINRHENDQGSNSTVQRAVHVLQREVGADGHWISSNLAAISNVSDLFQFTQRPNSDLPDYPQLHYRNVGLGTRDIRNEEFCDLPASQNDTICFDMVAAGI
jgi:hypothetical protein